MKSKYGILDEDLDGDVDFYDYLLTDDDEEDDVNSKIIQKRIENVFKYFQFFILPIYTFDNCVI